MNIRLLLDLIRYHYQRNNAEFDRATTCIADAFRRSDKCDIADYILAQMAQRQSFAPQTATIQQPVQDAKALDDSVPSHQLSELFVEIRTNPSQIPLPTALDQNIQGIRLAIDRRKMLSKFLFVGAPGTGKTEAVKQLAFSLNKRLFSVNFNQLIDSRLGQTAKNIDTLFKEISSIENPGSCLFLFDEIDGLSLTSTDNNDIREMGRATTAFIRGMDNLATDIIIFATTNLGEKIDPALRRRFDYTVSFDCYDKTSLVSSALFILSSFLSSTEKTDTSLRTAKKIFELSNLSTPGIIRNRIKKAVAFSDPDSSFSYLLTLYEEFLGTPIEIDNLSIQDFSLREIELITGKSKSQISRILNRQKS